ncbi:MAG: AMP-dependent synthetase [Acidobacteria bacterium]|nr:MAG: AMP-dependent synthetase [Acidobacteriota bacterium]
MGTGEIIWRPRPDDLENSHVARFMRRHGIADAAELRRRAAAEPEWFYPAIIDDLGIEWFEDYRQLYDDSRGLPWTEWFIGGRINIVHNCLDRHLRDGRGAHTAVIAEDDDENVVTLTYEQLAVRVSRLSAALAGLGLGAGDAVGFYLPMSADVVVALLACLKIGAVPVPVFAGFGPEALAARLRDAGAGVLLTADGTRRKGKKIALKPTADAGADLAESVYQVVVLRHSGDEIPWNSERDLWWHELEEAAQDEWATEELDASARSLILYTSGTTGKPKGAVHTHAGVQIVTAKEVGYHMDLRPGERLFWLTDIGWMMGPWEILGALFHGGTVVLLDGMPTHPGPDRLWAMVERHRITHLAVAPTAVRLLAGFGTEPLQAHDLSSLRVLGSTGEPWDAASYMWYFENVGGSRCPIINISGGTELMGCLLAPLPVAPLKPATLQGPALGMDVDVFDEEGRSVRGEVGYLVCKNAAPNMTRGFLNDPERYLKTYFERFGESVWFHGDWALCDEDGFWFLTGRADDTLKIAGKRIGPAEVEAAAVDHPAVREAAAVGLPDEIKGTRLELLAVPAPGVTPSDELGREVAAHIAEKMGPAMRPAAVRWVSALPVTRSGKIVRGVIRRVLMGQPPGDLSSVANPEAIDALR